MTHQALPLRGVIHGNTIELEQEHGLPEGQGVTVTIRPLLPPGEGIRQSGGTWADAGDDLEDWLQEMQRSRREDRPEPPG